MPNIQKPNEHFDVITYTGNGSTQATSLSFSPDLIWFKDRSTNSAVANTWQTKASFTTTAYVPTAVYGQNGKIYVMGGDGGTGTTRTDNRIYDIATNTWSNGAAVPGGSAAMKGVYYNGKIYLIGGLTGNNVVTNRVIAYDIATNTWQTSGLTSGPFASYYHGDIVGNKFYSIYIAPQNSSRVDIYNFDTNTWSTGTAAPAIPANTSYSLAAIDDKIYSFGVVNGSNASGIVYVYNTTTDSWSTAANMPTARLQTTAVKIGRRIYVLGGRTTTTGTPVSTAEYLDVDSNTWVSSGIATLPIPNRGFGLVAYNNQLYMLGGYNNTSLYLTTNYMYTLPCDHLLFDSIRGNKSLSSNLTAAEVNNPSGVISQGGVITLTDSITNLSGVPYTAWCWKAGNSTSTNIAGTITSTTNANQTAGFSIFTYTGNGTQNASVGHGLAIAPKFCIIKNRTIAGNNTIAYTTAIDGTNDFLYLTTNAAKSNSAASLPTSTLLYLDSGGASNNLANSYVAYCWNEVPGFSSFGSYTGNGNANGPFINLGFRPALLIIKCSSTTGNWVMLDDKRAGYNVDNDPVWANLANAEGTTDLADLLSNGFKIRSTDASINTNAATYVYAAWAEVPFNYSLGR